MMGNDLSLLFVENVLKNMPCWISVFFLMVAASRSYVKPPFGRTTAVAFAALLAVGAASAFAVSAMSAFAGLDEANFQTVFVLAMFWLVFRLSTTFPRRKLLFVFFSGITVAAFTILVNDIVVVCFTDTLPNAVRFTIDIAVSIALPLSLLPLFAGRMRWSLDQLGNEAWRGLWLIPIAFFGVAVSLYIMRFAVAFVEPWAKGFYALTGVLLVTLLAVAYRTLFATMQSMQENARLKAEAQLSSLEAARYATLRDHMRESAQARHDFRHRMLVLRALADEGDVAGLRSALDDESLAAAVPERGVLCANFAVDAVAAHFLARSRTSGTVMRCELALPERLPVAEADFCLAFANLLENAVEACERLGESAERRIDVHAAMRGDALVLRVENTCERCDAATRDGGIATVLEGEAVARGIPSTKHAGTGIGLASVASLARKYRGDVLVEQRDDLFAVSVAFRGQALS